MATMNISLPDQMKAWVEEQTKDGRYSNSSDYVRDLIRKAQVKAEKIAHWNALIEEAMTSGFTEMTMEEIMEEARAHIAARDQAA